MKIKTFISNSKEIQGRGRYCVSLKVIDEGECPNKFIFTKEEITQEDDTDIVCVCFQSPQKLYQKLYQKLKIYCRNYNTAVNKRNEMLQRIYVACKKFNKEYMHLDKCIVYEITPRGWEEYTSTKELPD